MICNAIKNLFNMTLIIYTVKHLLHFQKLKEKNIRRPYSMSTEGPYSKGKTAMLASTRD